MAPIRIEWRPWLPLLPVSGAACSESMATGLSEVSIRGDDGVLFIYSAGPKAVLAVMGPMGSNAGLIHLEARGIAKEIGDLF